MSVKSINAIKAKVPANGDFSKEAMQLRASLIDELNSRNIWSAGLFKRHTPWRFTLEGPKSQAFFETHELIMGFKHPEKRVLEYSAWRRSGKKPAKSNTRDSDIGLDAQQLGRFEKEILNLAAQNLPEKSVGGKILDNTALAKTIEKAFGDEAEIFEDDLIAAVAKADKERIKSLFRELNDELDSSNDYSKDESVDYGEDDSADHSEDSSADYSEDGSVDRTAGESSEAEPQFRGRNSPTESSREDVARHGSRPQHARSNRSASHGNEDHRDRQPNRVPSQGNSR